MKRQDPHRTGFCDGLFGRACQSPWRDDGWQAKRKNEEYLAGYLEGQAKKMLADCTGGLGNGSQMQPVN